ncbi:hypothetical protein FB451DRAFT_1480860 [Mycena latifolia]|nr:hypothetical protein FB451DRAFT_1480860 [Mycena latifolia]
MRMDSLPPESKKYGISSSTTGETPGLLSFTRTETLLQVDAHHLKLSVQLRCHNSILLDVSGPEGDITTHGSLRGTVADHGYDAVKDMIQDSLMPLASIEVNTSLKIQATIFLSAYNYFTTDVLMRSPYMEPLFSRDSAPVAVMFFQCRYPLVRFQWNIETPHYEVRELWANPSHPITLITRWSAWSPVGANPLVATGYICDTIILTEEGYPVIKKHQPELMKPMTLSQWTIESEESNPAARQVRQPEYRCIPHAAGARTEVFADIEIQSRQLTSVVTLSALFASIQPLVDAVSTSGGTALAVVGIVSAVVSIGVLFLGSVIHRIEQKTSKNVRTSRN